MVETLGSGKETDAVVVQSKTDLVRELPDFFDYLKEKTKLMDSTKRNNVFAVKKFIVESKSVTDPNDYNMFLMKYCHKKRSTWYFAALTHYVTWKFAGKEKREVRDTILEAMRYLKPSVSTPRKLPVVLDDERIKSVIAGIRDRKHRVIAMIQAQLGVRAGDVFRLRRGGIHYEPYKNDVLMALEIHGKGDKKYKMFVFDQSLQFEIEAFIRECWIDDEYYFMEKSKVEIDKWQTYKNNYLCYLLDLKRSMFKLGMSPKDWSTHDFRRNMARKVWDKYHDIMLLKEFLHHEMVETSVRYIRHLGLQVQTVQEDLYKDTQKKW